MLDKTQTLLQLRAQLGATCRRADARERAAADSAALTDAAADEAGEEDGLEADDAERAADEALGNVDIAKHLATGPKLTTAQAKTLRWNDQKVPRRAIRFATGRAHAAATQWDEAAPVGSYPFGLRDGSVIVYRSREEQRQSEVTSCSMRRAPRAPPTRVALA